MQITTINPATGEIIRRYEEMSADETMQIIQASHQAYLSWREYSIARRAEPVRKLAELLIERKHDYAVLMATEMGKPLLQGEAEVEKCAALCRHYADYAEEYLQPHTIKTEMTKSYVTYEPQGLVLGIMPWNFPFWQVFRFAVPTMMAGNGALLKHAPISTGTAVAIEKLFKDAGCAENIFRTLIISNETAADVMAHPHVAAVTFTGSVAAGRIIAAEAGRALKKTVLELGGSDPYVILADADLQLAVDACVTSRMSNTGQSCIAPKRLIVVDSVHENFVQLLQEKVSGYIMGNPLEPSVKIGPMAREDLRDHLHQQVEECIAKGAKLVRGGHIPDMPGFYYPPTILTDIKKGMPAYQEELFGPVLAVITAASEEEALAIANSTEYGLGAGVFTKDIARGEHIAAKILQAGTCVVNTFVASDSRLPFGGIKNSGYGRELAREGILSFVNVKTVNVK